MNEILNFKFLIFNRWLQMKNSKFKIQNSAWVCGILFTFFSAMPQAYADQQGGQRPAAYLELGAGGTQNAMAGAAVAGRNDVANGFWNPAGLSGLRGFQVEDQYTVLSLGQQLNYLSFANGFREMFFYGISFLYYSAGGDLEARTGPSLNPDSVFGDTELAFLTSVAFRLDHSWSIGGNIKVLVQNFNNFNGFGLGEDLGVQYRVTKNTTLGFVIQDPFTFFDYDNSVEDIFPITVKAGIAQHDETLAAKWDFDLEWSSDLGVRPRLGVEWRPAEVLALRGGCWLGNITSGVSGGGLSVNPTAGFGLLIPVGENAESLMEFDYTILADRTDPGNLLHQISLTGKFL
jgi:hypothetical protein